MGVIAALALAPASEAWIYWGHFAYQTGVGRAALDGTQADEDFIAAPPGTYAFARGVAADSSYLYWGTHGLDSTQARPFTPPRIGRSDLSGANQNQSFTASTGQSLTSLGVSPSHLYWSSSNQDTGGIGRTPVIGGQQYQAFESKFGEPHPQPCGVATDGTYVYFANRTTSSIGRATLANYATAQQVVEGQWIQRPASAALSVHPCGVAVDAKYVFWGVYETSRNGVITPGATIGRALKSNGSGATDDFAGGGRRVTGLAIDGKFLYTSNWNDGVAGTGSIGRANLDASGWDADFVGGLNAPYGVAVEGGGPAPAPPTPPPTGDYHDPLSVGCSGCGGGGGAAPSSVPPDFSRVWGSHKKFVPASWSTPLLAVAKGAAAPKGTVFNYILDKPGTVKIAITQATKGRRAGKKCVPPSRRNAGKRPCRRTVTVVTLTRVSHAGVNHVPFSGRIRGKALKPGSYKAVFTALAQTGSATKTQSYGFRIARP